MALILVVDDDSLIRESLTAALRRAGHAAIVAENGQEGLSILECQDVDLVIADLVMPIMNGVDMIATLRKRGQAVAVVAMSGGPDGGEGPTLTDATDAGADAVLSKPFTISHLLDVIGRHLAGC